MRSVNALGLLGLLICTVPMFAAEPAWKSLFDGKTLKNWKSTNFGGEGEVDVVDGAIVLERGSEITGITWTGEKPASKNYELSLEAQRVSGGDFFCGLTFPINDSACSFIVGGWGGGVVGLSSLNGQDASENETTSYRSFKSKQWYKIRLRVNESHVQAWIDDERVVNADIRGKRITVRSEVELSRPLGICSFGTVAALRNIKVRNLTEAESKEIPQD